MRLLNLLICIFCSSCIWTSNYYTAKTLPPYTIEIMGGIENIKSVNENTNPIKKDTKPTPIIGMSAGLPSNFETGIRYAPESIVELYLRNQITPKKFELAALSLNIHYGAGATSYSFLKYGGTGGLAFKNCDLFVGYYKYAYLGGVTTIFRNASDFDKKYRRIVGKALDLSTGASFEFSKFRLIGEYNRTFSSNDFKSYYLGIALAYKIKLNRTKLHGT